MVCLAQTGALRWPSPLASPLGNVLTCGPVTVSDWERGVQGTRAGGEGTALGPGDLASSHR